MNMTNFDETMQLFFDKLDISPVSFNYNERNNYYISEPILYEDDPQNPFFIRIDMTNSIGTVKLGTSLDYIKFTEIDVLGQVQYLNGKWANI